MNEEVAVIIPTTPVLADAFLKIFPGAQIRKIKRKEQPAEKQQEPVQEAPVGQDREKLLHEIVAFCQERKSSVDAVRFFNYYDGRGWLDAGGKKITDWKQKLIDWENNGIMNRQKPSSITGGKVVNFSREQMDKMIEEMEKI